MRGVKLRFQLSAQSATTTMVVGGLLFLLGLTMIPVRRSWMAQQLKKLAPVENATTATVQGQITYCDRDRGVLYLQSSRHAWRVETDEIEAQIVLGSWVEAKGIMTDDFGSSLLQLATLRVLRPAGPLSVQTIQGSELADPRLRDHLVSVTGIVKQSTAERLNQIDLQLQVDAVRTQVRLFDWTGLNPTHLLGRQVKVQGILTQPGPRCADVPCRSLLRTDHLGLMVLTQEDQPSPLDLERNVPALTRVSQVHRLSSDQAARHLPVRLIGVVTAVENEYFFLQDPSGGIFIDQEGSAHTTVQVGQQITLTGQTGPGQFAPIVVKPHVEAATNGRLPKASPVDLARVLAGSEDSNWIEVEATIHAAGWEHGSAYLRAETNGVPFRILVSGAHELPFTLLDRKVRVAGVCATEFNLLRQFVGFYVDTPSLDFIHPEEPPQATASLPRRPIADFGSFSWQQRPGHRERVQGIVTFHSPLLTYIQDPSGSLKVESAEPLASLQAGDLVEAVGFSQPKAFGPVMVDSFLRKIGTAAEPVRPRLRTADDLLDQGLEGELVTVEATLLDRSALAGGEILSLHAGHLGFLARLEGSPAPPAPLGSLLQLTGIPVLQARRGHPYAPSSLTLLINSARDVRIVHAPPWWNARFMMYGFGLVVLTAALIAFWALALRRQVKRQTTVIRTQLTEAQELRQQAESAARLKSEFLANMSHEIRTPLNGILGMTDLALTEPINPVVRDYLETVKSSGVGLLQVINDVLDLSKMEAGHLTLESIAFDFKANIQSAVALLQPAAAAKGLGLAMIFPEQMPRWFSGDPLRLRQILLNLLGNAIKFTASGGVTVRIACGPPQEGMAQIEVQVRDTGIGISPDKQAYLFQNFTQADSSTTRQYGGTGLGLAISKRLVERMGGSIGVNSQIGEGSSFWFAITLPVAEFPTNNLSEASGEKGSKAISAQPSLRGRVLLAEDNAVNRQLVRTLLERMGLEVQAVKDGQEALNAFCTQPFDVVLMDCQMPHCDGYEATAAIRHWEAAAQRERTTIIALTAHALPGDRELCLQSGMDDYLTKPIQAHELRQALVSRCA